MQKLISYLVVFALLCNTTLSGVSLASEQTVVDTDESISIVIESTTAPSPEFLNHNSNTTEPQGKDPEFEARFSDSMATLQYTNINNRHNNTTNSYIYRPTNGSTFKGKQTITSRIYCSHNRPIMLRQK